MGWEDDLQNLLGEIGGNVATSGVGQAGINALTSGPATMAFDVLDFPASVVRESLGQSINVAQGEGLGGWGAGQGQWDESIEGLRQSDLGPLGILKWPLEQGANILADPLTYAGVGLVGKAARGIRGAGEVAQLAGRPVLGGGLRAASYPLEALQFANDAPGRYGLPPLQAAVRGVGRGVGKVLPNALQESERSLRQNRAADLQNLATARASIKNTPRVGPQTHDLQIEDVMTNPRPPAVPNLHPPTSAPARIYSGFTAAASRLFAKFGSQRPLGIANVGTDPAQPLGSGGQWGDPLTAGKNVTDEDLQDMATVGVGIMQTITDSDGLFMALERAGEGMKQLREEIVAKYGSGMVPLLPLVYRRMREQLGDRADELMPADRFILPHGWADGTAKMARLGTQQTKARLSFTPRKQAKLGKTPREKALFDLEAGSAKGTPEIVEQAAAMGAAFLSLLHQGDEATLAAFRPGGVWFPQALQTSTRSARAAVPTTFNDAVWKGHTDAAKLGMDLGVANQLLGVEAPFGTMRQAWDEYMRKQFGGGMKQDELDYLANQSTDLLYDTFINSANEVSGGPMGATRIAQAINPETGEFDLELMKSVAGEDQYYPDVYQAGKKKGQPHPQAGTIKYHEGQRTTIAEDKSKIGALATDRHHIGSEYAQEIIRTGEAEGRIHFSSKNGRIGSKSLHQEQLRRELGVDQLKASDVARVLEKKKVTLSPNMVQQALRKLGVEPIVENPTGGMLPNLSRLVEIFQKGAPLQLSPFTRAREWYPGGAREIEAIVGSGNYEDASLLLDFIAVTSPGTEVSENMRFATRALAEWKYGKDDTIRQFGITGEQFQQMRQGGLLHADMAANHRTGLERAMNEYIARRESPNRMPIAVTGGAKTFDYSSSFLVNIWRDMLDEAELVNPAVAGARKAFDDALTILTVDRHHNRVENLATAVNKIENTLIRERGILASKHLGMSGEEAQASAWYWVRDQQGFVRELRPDSDVVFALRRAIEDAYNTGSLEPNAFQTAVDAMAVKLGVPNTAPEAYRATYDASRQLIFYGLLKQSMDNPKVAAELRKAGLPDTLPEFQNDVLSVVTRGAHGLDEAEEEVVHPIGIVSGQTRGVTPEAWTEGLGPKPAMDLMDKTRETLSGIADGSTFGATLGWNGRTWDYQEPTSGFAVAITSAGQAVTPATAKTALKTVNRWIASPEIADLFDPVMNYGNESRLWFGLFPMDEAKTTASFDLVTIVPDQATAVRLGRELNQQSIYDFSTGELIETGGSGVPVVAGTGGVTRILDSVHGPRAPRPKPTIQEVRERGVTMAELDVVNPFTIYQRKIKKPIMDAYAEASLKRGVQETSGRTIDDLGLEDWDEFADTLGDTQRLDPRLTLQQNQLMLTTMKDGTTYGDFLRQQEVAAGADQQALRDAGVTWGAYTSKADRIKAADGNADLEKIIKRWTDDGIDILHGGDPESVAAHKLAKTVDVEDGYKAARPTTYDLLKSAWSEQALLSFKYHTGNFQGGYIQNLLAGYWDWPPGRDVFSAFKGIRGGADEVGKQDALASLKASETASKWGLDGPPAEVLRGGIKALTMSSDEYGPSAMGQLIGRATRNERLGQKAGWIFTVNNDLGLAVDTAIRGSLWEQVFDERMKEYLPLWEKHVRERGSGIPGFEFSVTDSINPPRSFKPDDLTRHFVDLGIPAGQAEHLMRQFVQVRGLALKDAKKELDRVQFYGSRTNLDEWIGKVIPFHYWFSRALRYYGEETIRHPFLLLNYLRAVDGIEDANNDPGLSARQKGFLRLFGTPIGFSLLTNLDALFGVVKVFGLDQYERESNPDARWSDPPEGYTPLGGALDWLKQRGVGIYPWLDGSLNLMGVYGNTFEPDLLGIRHKAIVGAAVNFARAHTGFDPLGAPYANAMGQARYGVSSFVASLGLDWLSQPVTPRAGESSQEAALETVIESIIVQNNPGLTNAQLLEVMVNPDHPEYERAYQQASDAGVVQQLLNFTLPTSFRMRHDATDVRRSQIELVNDEAQKSGKAPYEIAPTLNDMDFLARYKAMTGNAYKPGDYLDAKTKHDLVRAPEEAKPFILAEAEYNALGTPEQKRQYDRYMEVLTGKGQYAGVDENTRYSLARQFLDRNRGAGRAVDEIRQLKVAYEAAHPEFAEFKSWQDRMYDLSDQLGGSLAEYRRQATEQNPNAARYFADQWRWITTNLPEDEWAAQFERATANASAFLAITGKTSLRSVQGPFPGTPPVDVTLPSMQLPAASGYGGGGYDWASDLAAMGRNAGIPGRPGFA